MTPTLILVAGANGSGKSTLTARWKERFKNKTITVLDPDAIAKTMNSGQPVQARVKAARYVLETTQELLVARSSFILETTLSDRQYHIRLLQQAKRLNYRIWLLYTGVTKPEILLNRVADRVRAGGHNVPDEDILRRYKRSLENLPLALQLVDKALIYDNSGRHNRLIGSVQQKRLRTIVEMLWLKEMTTHFESLNNQ